VQALNIEDVLVKDTSEFMGGMNFKRVQLANMLAVVVADEKSNCGTCVKLLHVENMLDKSVTSAVLKSGTVFKVWHVENIEPILVQSTVAHQIQLSCLTYRR